MNKRILLILLLVSYTFLVACQETRSDLTWMKPIETKDNQFLYQYYTGQEQIVVDSAAKRCQDNGWGQQAKPGKSFCEDMPPSEAPSDCATSANCQSCQTWLSCTP